ncbi:Cupredoxin [Xylariaceae sp. FL0016]|nr:Cupredoxin [Xylariaceae sp. FL0016]
MLGHRSSSSSSEFMMYNDEGEVIPSSSPELEKESEWRSEAMPTQSLCGFFHVFIFSHICLCVVVLSLILGLGLGWYRCGLSKADVPSLFNYSAYYGIPERLSFVTIESLVNSKELELDTGFEVDSPTTTREYEFNITQASAAPDGYAKPMILVNEQSPGPLIEANSGDTIRVHVNNLMANWSTSIHWHGIDQRKSTWMDGVTSVTQCGIPPGDTFTYEFTVKDQRGTFWWHAHLSTQYGDGAYGPIVIHDTEEMVPRVDTEKVIFISDLYHMYSSVLLTSYLKPGSKWTPSTAGVEPLPDNIIMNGRNTYDCSVTSSTFPPTTDAPANCTGGSLHTTKVKSGQKARFRFINSSQFLSYWISIDNHTLEIVELDGIEIQPISARGVYINLGQRVSVIITANQTVGNYYIRATLAQTCFLPYAPYTSTGLESSSYHVSGILSYDDVSLDEKPIGISGNVSNPYGVENNNARGDAWEGCDDMPFDMPKPMREIAAYEVSENNTHYIEFEFRQAQDVNRIFINKTAYAPLPDNATLWKTKEQDFATGLNSYNSWDFGLNQQVLLIPDADKGAQIVINSKDGMEHPWHLHGHTFQVAGWGPGPFGTNQTTWSLANPMRRDTVTVPAFSHVALRFKADNPGLWALHCHVAWHMEGGMFVSLAERPDDLARLIDDMDPTTRAQSQGFCGDQRSGGQAFGSTAQYKAPS